TLRGDPSRGAPGRASPLYRAPKPVLYLMGGSLCPHSPRRRGGMVNPSDATSTSGWAYGPAAVRMGGSLVPARGSRAARWVSGREWVAAVGWSSPSGAGTPARAVRPEPPG